MERVRKLEREETVIVVSRLTISRKSVTPTHVPIAPTPKAALPARADDKVGRS